MRSRPSTDGAARKAGGHPELDRGVLQCGEGELAEASGHALGGCFPQRFGPWRLLGQQDGAAGRASQLESQHAYIGAGGGELPF